MFSPCFAAVWHLGIYFNGSDLLILVFSPLQVRARTSIGYGANSTSVAVILFRAIAHETNSTAITVTPDHTRTTVGYGANSTAITVALDGQSGTAFMYYILFYCKENMEQCGEEPD